MPKRNKISRRKTAILLPKRSGWSLENAWAEGRFDIVEELVCLGARFDNLTQDDTLLLYDAVVARQISLVKLLLFKGAQIDGPNTDDNTPLISACWNNIPHAVDILIDHGADVNQINGKRQATPLFIASQEGHLEVVKTLLRRGAIVDTPRKDGTTPLLMACDQEKWDVVTVLLNYGARGDHPDENGLTPIHVACKKNASTSIIKLMLSKETRVNVTRWIHDKYTPLHVACENNYIDIVELLLMHGAKVNSDEELGFVTTPLFEACSNGNTDIVNVLLKNGALVDIGCMETGCTPLFSACENNYLSIAKILVANGAYVNAIRGSDGATPLFVACECEHMEIIDFLLKSGADVNHERISDGETPLSMVMQNPQPDILIMLLSKGARVDVPGLEDPVYDLLISCCQNEFGIDKSTTLAKMLILNGAKTLSAREIPVSCSPEIKLIVSYLPILNLCERLWLMLPAQGGHRVHWAKIGIGKAFATSKRPTTLAISVILKSVVNHDIPWNIQIMIFKKMISD